MTTPTKTTKSFEQKMTKDGKLNPKYVDLLSEDPVISNQPTVRLLFVRFSGKDHQAKEHFHV